MMRVYRHRQPILLKGRPNDALRAGTPASARFDQEPENQLQELRYVEARGWTAVEYVDRGVSGAKDRRPELDRLIADAKRRHFDVLVCWRLDRLGRNLKHLITLLEELQALGVEFVSLAEGIDATTPAGKLQMHILGAIAAFERARIAERVKAGLQRARAQGKRLGRPTEKRPPGHRGSWRVCARRRPRLGGVEVHGRALDQRGTNTGAIVVIGSLSAGGVAVPSGTLQVPSFQLGPLHGERLRVELTPDDQVAVAKDSRLDAVRTVIPQFARPCPVILL